MKRFLTIAAATVFALCTLSCKKGAGEEPAKIDISGEWKLSSLNGVSADEIKVDENGLDVYIRFGSDLSFETFQRLVGGSSYVRYSGNYKVSGYTGTGTYSDGSSWNGGAYTLSMEGDDLYMVSGSEECVYARTKIPEEVRGNAVDDMYRTKSPDVQLPGKFL